MFSIEVKEKVQNGQLETRKITSHKELSDYISRQLDAKWSDFFKNKPKLPVEQNLVNCIQLSKNTEVLIVKVREDIKTLLNELNVDELVKLYGLMDTFNILKEKEINRLKGIEKLAYKTDEFNSMSTNKVKATPVKHSATLYENMEFDISFSKMTHQQLVNLAYNKIVSIDKDELNKATEIKYFLNDKYEKQLKSTQMQVNISEEERNLMKILEDKLSELRNLDKVLSASNLLKAYKFDQDNKNEEAGNLVKGNPDLKDIHDYLEQNLAPEFSKEREIDVRELKKQNNQVEKSNDEVSNFINDVLDRIDEISTEYYSILENKFEGRATTQELQDVNKQLMKVLLTRLPEILKEKLAKLGLSNEKKRYLSQKSSKPEFQNLIVSVFKNRQKTRRGLQAFKAGSNI